MLVVVYLQNKASPKNPSKIFQHEEGVSLPILLQTDDLNLAIVDAIYDPLSKFFDAFYLTQHAMVYPLM
jgi:hypothetical protein